MIIRQQLLRGYWGRSQIIDQSNGRGQSHNAHDVRVKENQSDFDWTPSMPYTKILYGTDIVAWSDQQAQLLRDRRWDELDLDNLIEEVGDLGGRHRDRVESYLNNLLMHWLKCEYQPKRRTTSWDVSIKTSALNIRKEIKRHPSLRRHFINSFEESYQYARELASIETQLELEVFPVQCSAALKDEVWRVCQID